MKIGPLLVFRALFCFFDGVLIFQMPNVLPWCLALSCGSHPALVDSLPTQYALTIAYLLLKLLELILEDYHTTIVLDTDDSDSPDSVTPRTFNKHAA